LSVQIIIIFSPVIVVFLQIPMVFASVIFPNAALYGASTSYHLCPPTSGVSIRAREKRYFSIACFYGDAGAMLSI